ncbi:hypothetical protein MIND_01016700 [Mycena indigotica]|uniref:Uncharacterized protein n=1 Tax=Mycena indigotica TaxID=2126181 RepID=A0A8H6SBF9_9AGAR|nr:uncharacterized protein MIND_01016700 [Mycena indigotica]KAF7294790.1 hypothetical protein MIND_01016700 [Mycena indigotica]
MTLGPVFFAALAFSRFALAQTTNATCEVSHKWASNSQKQSPCEVASSLVAVCSGSYEVGALPDGFHYNGPDVATANPCWCNTVTYSMFSECALCQGRTFVMWSLWEINCKSVTKDAFPNPLPAGLHVPGWAYLDVEAGDQFNETLAFANANITESTAASQPSKTSAPISTSRVTSSAAAATSSASPPAADDSGQAPLNQKRINAIGGGVVGGFAALVVVALALFCFHRKRRIAQTQGAVLESPTMSEHRPEHNDNLEVAPSMSQRSIPSITVSSLHSQQDTTSHRARDDAPV